MLIIYYNKEKTSMQRVQPSSEFKGDWYGLVQGITLGNYHSFDVV